MIKIYKSTINDCGYKQISFDSSYYLRPVSNGEQENLTEGDYLMVTKWVGGTTRYMVWRLVDGRLISLKPEESTELRLTVNFKYPTIHRWLATSSNIPEPSSFKRSCKKIEDSSFGNYNNI